MAPDCNFSDDFFFFSLRKYCLKFQLDCLNIKLYLLSLFKNQQQNFKCSKLQILLVLLYGLRLKTDLILANSSDSFLHLIYVYI